MGLLKKLTDRVLGTPSKEQEPSAEKKALLRRCYFEVMEERRVLSANAVIAGVTYLEGDAGQDSTPDHFEVTFEGGAETTQLTQFTINGDQDSSGGLSDGDMFFDVDSAQPGAAASHPFVFDAENSRGVTAADIKSVSISADGLELSVEVDNFDAGDVFAFTIDVDEVERFRTDEIASGVEFEGTFFNATFVDQHYDFSDKDVAITATLYDGFQQPQFEGVFFDEYDQLFDAGGVLAGAGLDLTLDNEEGNENRTAAAIDAYDLTPKPITISGTVYHDENLNCEHDADEQGISGVEIQLQRLNDNGQFVTVAITTTDSQGNYEFGEDLNLMPGTFQLVEVQPDGYLDVGAEAGSEGGVVSQSLNGDKNVIGQINIELGGTAATDYDFKEVRPASISGHVWHDENNDGVFDTNESGIANVLIQVTRVGAKSDVAEDPFANSEPIFVRTDAQGHYSVDALPPGIYEIVEINSYPAGQVDPLAGFTDGKDSLGSVGGLTIGNGTNDRFTNIELCAGDDGVEYNFGEIMPAEICGIVYHDLNNNGVLEAGEDRIGGVVIELFDKSGDKIAETRTDAQGNYCFLGLIPGEYFVRETQPTSFLDGQDTLGQIGGLTAGEMTNDEFCVKLDAGDSGQNYNFGELKPSSISGTVHGDANGDCVFNPADGDRPLQGVQLILLDATGNEIARTVTDANGDYSFDNLAPGTYSVREITPDGYLDGEETLGQVNGQTIGNSSDDFFSGIVLTSGQQATNYDFCEHIPAELCGTVYHDRNNNGVQDSGEEGIEGTRMVLTDANGVVIAETFTDGNGEYCFGDLIPGTYCVTEIQPAGYIDGTDSVGNVNGVTNGSLIGTQLNDQICNIQLVGGDQGSEYNFGELLLAEISGQVHTDSNGNCVFDAGVSNENPLANVTLELLDADGAVIATTTTNGQGRYSFNGLLPGEYAIRQAQPEGLFSGGEVVGSGGGLASENLIESIFISSGQKLTEYNFCEVEAAEIHGRVWEDGPAIETTNGELPDNYRELRDGVYQAGVDVPLEGVRMQLYFFLDPTTNSTVPRPVTLADVQGEYYDHMGTSDPNAGVWVDTMADGQYWFQGLPPGRYIVLQTQPEGYVDSNDTPGTTSGFTYNSFGDVGQAPASIVSQFSATQIMDSVVNIGVEAGDVSLFNNFSEVRSVTVPEPPVLPPPNPPEPPGPPGNPLPPGAGVSGLAGLAGSQSSQFTQILSVIGVTAQPQVAEAYTWHLSVVNAGLPRGTEDGLEDTSTWLQAGFISNSDWGRFDMDDVVWSFTQTNEFNQISDSEASIRFGMLGGIPLAGDFDGDGTDEVAMFKDGYWFIDLNRNGIWDETDLLAKLGDADDRPVVGDWDGDGKDDIGIYGPIWARDREAIAREPGLPNPDNSPFTQPKNVPPVEGEETSGTRIMKLTSYGRQRSDVVDHVFGVGDHDEIPVTGDWNGNGIRSIGTFRAGVWNLDINGDGRFDHQDSVVQYGRAGDVPLVGDFNGDGIEEIAVFRSGTWMIDSNGNRELDATDKTFEMGGTLDRPVVGDWDGDGVDEPAIVTERGSDLDTFQ